MSKRTPRRMLATLRIVSLAFAFVACVGPAPESEKSGSSLNETVLSQEEVDKKYRKRGDGRQRRPSASQRDPGCGTGVAAP